MISEWIENLKDICNPLVMLGTGTAVCWILLLAASPVFTTSSISLSHPIPWRSTVLVSCFCTFAVAILIEKKMPLILGNLTGSTGALASSAASIVGALVHSFVETTAAQYTSAALIGFSTASIALAWSQPLSDLPLRKRIAAAASGSIVGCLLFMAIAFIRQPFDLFVGIALSPISLGCLYSARQIGRPWNWNSSLA